MPTYNQLAKNILTSGSGSFEFTNIPQNYTDLVIRISCRNNQDQGSGNAACALRFNNNSNSLYGWIPWTYSAGGSAFSVNLNYTDFEGYMNSVGSNNTANLFTNSEYYIPAYTQTGGTKSFLTNAAFPSSVSRAQYATNYNVGSFRDTTAISSIQIIPVYGVFVAGSIFILYGIGA